MVGTPSGNPLHEGLSRSRAASAPCDGRSQWRNAHAGTSRLSLAPTVTSMQEQGSCRCILARWGVLVYASKVWCGDRSVAHTWRGYLNCLVQNARCL
eukprot:2125517-Prymnesium_polylepis.1